MRIKESITDEDLDFLYDCLIFTFITEMVMVALAMVTGVI